MSYLSYIDAQDILYQYESLSSSSSCAATPLLTAFATLLLALKDKFESGT